MDLTSIPLETRQLRNGSISNIKAVAGQSGENKHPVLW